MNQWIYGKIFWKVNCTSTNKHLTNLKFCLPIVPKILIFELIFKFCNLSSVFYTEQKVDNIPMYTGIYSVFMRLWTLLAVATWNRVNWLSKGSKSNPTIHIQNDSCAERKKIVSAIFIRVTMFLCFICYNIDRVA